MILLCIFVLTGVTIGIVHSYRSNKSWKERSSYWSRPDDIIRTPQGRVIAYTVGYSVTGLIFGLLTASIIGGFQDHRTWTPVPKEEVSLHGLSNTAFGSRSGFIFISVKSGNVYTYYYPVEKGPNGEQLSNSYRSDTLVADVILTEVEGINSGTLISNRNECDGGFFHKWRLCWEDSKKRKYEFIVPSGTVVNDYKLD